MFEKIKEIIKENDAGKRLDKFLVGIFKDYSRTDIQKKIKLGEILVNNKKVAPHHFLKVDDVVFLENLKEKNKKIVAVETDLKSVPVKKSLPQKLIPNKNIKVEIIFEDDNYLVVNKPVGLVVHPAVGHTEQDTFVNWLISYLPKIEKVGQDKMRPGIVHRLDKDASGLMVVAKTNKAYKSLRKQFDDGKTSKEYNILVSGDIKDDEGTIQISLGRSKKGFKIVKKEDGRKAITHYLVVARFRGYTLLNIETETGRMHQIRAHFFEIRHPIVGDGIYSGNTKVLRRLFLHAGRLGFLDLDNKWREYEIKLDKKLENFLVKLRK